MSLDALHALAATRGVPWDALASDLSDLYEWQVSTMETNVRFRVALREVRSDVASAIADAEELRDAALAAGFVLHSRCELTAVASTDEHFQVQGWRGLVDLGLLPAALPVSEQ